jgi:CTP:molybdopterin cytidylyltransferase MocA
VEAVVLAAGEGRRLRPLTERWAKPVLPIDGKPVITTLLDAIEEAGLGTVTVVVGYLGDQVRRLLAGRDVRFADQPEALGSADAVRRALAAGAAPPLVITAADTLYADGDIGRFLAEWRQSGAAGALAPPLWGLGAELVGYLDELPGPPYELRTAFRRAGDDSFELPRVELGPMRSLTTPIDVVSHNFVYLEDIAHDRYL